jgi:4'-phosphopantetheinyl transferase
VPHTTDRSPSITTPCVVALARLDRPLPDPAIDLLLGTLDPTRRALLLRYQRRIDCERGLMGDVLARTVVASLSGRRPNAVGICRAASGSPGVPDVPGLRISISHAGRWAVCAVAPGPVGVDVERLRPVSPAVLGRTCADPCFDEPLDERLRRLRVIQAWTMKEAYLKLIGTGLAVDPGEVRLERRAGYTEVRGPAPYPEARARVLELDADHRLAVCTPHVPAPVLERVDSHELVAAYAGDETPFTTRSFDDC